MLVYVISDTHIPDRAHQIPPQLWKAVGSSDVLLHAGDFTDLSVLNEIKGKAGTVHAVWGNMDPEIVRRALPEKQMLDIGDYRIGIYHGSGAAQGLVEKVYHTFPEKLDAIIFGHSHTPYNKKIKKTLMFNPGSITFNRSGPPTYGILHLDEGGIWGEHVEIKS
jgi:putative phosphoesterase